jgi:hypothetical protein
VAGSERPLRRTPDGYKSAEEQEAEAQEVKQREEEHQRIAEEQQKQEAEEQQEECQKAEAQMAALHTSFGTTQQELNLWSSLLQEFKLSMPAASFYGHVADTILLSLKDGEALIGLPNPRARDWLENRFSKKIERTLASSLKQKVTVKFIELNPAHEPLSVSQAGTR